MKLLLMLMVFTFGTSLQTRFMVTARFVVSVFSVGLTVLSASGVSGQEYPNRPIRIITSEIGGGTDLTSRLIAPAISVPLGQPVIVDNRVVVIAIESVAKAPPDGYTLLVVSTPLWLGPFLRGASWDPVQDFSPISMTDTAPDVLVVHPSLPVKSVKELIALAKARPGQLNYAASGVGAIPHLSAELFKGMAGVNITRVQYKGAAAAFRSMISGEVEVYFPVWGPVVPHLKSGKLIALAVTTAQPSPRFPGLPTIAATVPGYESVGFTGIFAPAKTPAAIINRLNQEIVRILSRTDVKERLLSIGIEATPGSPQQFAANIKSDMAKWGKVIKDVGIRAD